MRSFTSNWENLRKVDPRNSYSPFYVSFLMKIGHNCDFSPRPTIFKKSKITLKPLLCKKYLTRCSSKVLKCSFKTFKSKIDEIANHACLGVSVHCGPQAGFKSLYFRVSAWPLTQAHLANQWIRTFYNLGVY